MAAARAGQGPVPVTTASVMQKSMPIEISVIGSAEPFSTVAIRAQTTGQLTSVNFTEGDDVTKGQVLFTLDRRPLEAALQQAQANLERDLAQAANAAREAKRYQDLAERGIATARAGRHLATRRWPRSTPRSTPTAPRSRTRRSSCSTRRSPRRSPAAPAR